MSTTQIDDSDPSVIHTGTWVKGGTAHEFKSTTSSSTTPGDTITVPFTGMCLLARVLVLCGGLNVR